ncbi:conserved protein of unknown function [Nitrospira japonica]|uniref:Uncharacterized protein n=1 Tax=Nitrospira japonica TaxID=1325564 RepID=A0A1W1I1S7_9BACT|nr:hypothetical protein [Nitrospira japonica]SLM46947.1 conserved protein of unknown function [Nitrospira japonica]
MANRWAFPVLLSAVALLFEPHFPPIPSSAVASDVGTIIEQFVTQRFPEAATHYWIINETQWDGDEIIIDVHTIVQDRRDPEPTLNRFLLLIVAGELKGSQNIPLEPGAECRPEQSA